MNTDINPYSVWLFRGTDVKLYIKGFASYEIAERMLTSISNKRNLSMRKGICGLAPGGVGWLIQDGDYLGFVTRKGSL
jgi:hypothetical protein